MGARLQHTYLYIRAKKWDNGNAYKTAMLNLL